MPTAMAEAPVMAMAPAVLTETVLDAAMAKAAPAEGLFATQRRRSIRREDTAAAGPSARADLLMEMACPMKALPVRGNHMESKPRIELTVSEGPSDAYYTGTVLTIYLSTIPWSPVYSEDQEVIAKRLQKLIDQHISELTEGLGR